MKHNTLLLSLLYLKVINQIKIYICNSFIIKNPFWQEKKIDQNLEFEQFSSLWNTETANKRYSGKDLLEIVVKIHVKYF